MASKKTTKRARKKNGGGDSFVVLFTSLSMILLAFFILLNSLAVLDLNRKLVTMGSLAGSFKILPGGVRLSDGPEPLIPSVAILKKEAREALKDLKVFISTHPIGHHVKWYARDNGLVLTMMGSVLFPPGEKEIPPEARGLLERVAEVIRHFPRRVQVEGHTDDGPVPPGAPESHWGVSGNRAVRVVRYMTEVLGLEPRRFSAVSYGPQLPLVPNTSPQNRARNRRVDIVLRGDFRALKSRVIDVKGFLFPVKGFRKR